MSIINLDTSESGLGAATGIGGFLRRERLQRPRINVEVNNAKQC